VLRLRMPPAGGSGRPRAERDQRPVHINTARPAQQNTTRN
jgi:hypothetical protein